MQCAESFLSFWAKIATAKEFILSTIWPTYKNLVMSEVSTYCRKHRTHSYILVFLFGDNRNIANASPFVLCATLEGYRCIWPSTWHLISISSYRPHPKDGEATVFTGVCLSTPGVGVSQSQVLSRGYSSPRFPLPPALRDRTAVSTCYAAGGMPLAFTQEDFLVSIKFKFSQDTITYIEENTQFISHIMIQVFQCGVHNNH